jgi:flagellar hook-basal body complex protein FliE
MSAGAIQAIAASMNSSAFTNGIPTQMQSAMTSQLSGPGFGPTPATDGSESMPFADLMTDAVGEVNRLQDTAKSAVKGLMTGTGVDVHQAMIATEKASMAFELALSVRNKAVQAYQQVMSMQF